MQNAKANKLSEIFYDSIKNLLAIFINPIIMVSICKGPGLIGGPVSRRKDPFFKEATSSLRP